MNPGQPCVASTATVEMDPDDDFCAKLDFDQIDAAAAAWFLLNPLPATTKVDETVDYVMRLLDGDDDETDGTNQQAEQSTEEWSQGFAGKVEEACDDAGRMIAEAETAASSKLLQEPSSTRNRKRGASCHDGVESQQLRLNKKSQRIAARQLRGKKDGVQVCRLAVHARNAFPTTFNDSFFKKILTCCRCDSAKCREALVPRGVGVSPFLSFSFSCSFSSDVIVSRPLNTTINKERIRTAHATKQNKSK